MLAVMNYASGLLVQVLSLPMLRQEVTCLTRLFKDLSPGDLILGDRALVNFAALTLLQAAGLAGCFRLPQRLVTFAAGRPGADRLTRLGRQDHRVMLGGAASAPPG